MDRRKGPATREQKQHVAPSFDSSSPPIRPPRDQPRASSSKHPPSVRSASSGRVAAQVDRLDHQARHPLHCSPPADYDLDQRATAGARRVKEQSVPVPSPWPPGGYYLPPPGYAADSGFWRPEQPPSDEMGHFAGFPYLQFDSPPRAQIGEETWMSGRQNGLSMRDLAPRLFPHLSHPNWSVPQAKAVLSTWSVLATLSAGGSATLLTQYLTDKISNLAISLNYAALILNIWGAALSAVSIVISITFQAPARSSPSETSKARRGVDLESGPHASQHPFAEPTLSQLASLQERRVMTPMLIEMLDRVAVAVGWIVPLAACCELAGVLVYAYTAHHGALAPVAASVALGVCLLVTGAALFAGWRGAKLRNREAVLYEAIVAAGQRRSGHDVSSKRKAGPRSDTSVTGFSIHPEKHAKPRLSTTEHRDRHAYDYPHPKRHTDNQEQEAEFVEKQHLLAVTGGAA